MSNEKINVSLNNSRVISMSETGFRGAQPLASPYHWCPRSPLLLRDGSILLNFHAYTPDITGKEDNLVLRYTAFLRSLDGGLNWYYENPANPFEEGDRLQLEDGTVFGLSYNTYVNRNGEVFGYVYRSRDDGWTFDRPQMVPFSLPEKLRISPSVLEGKGSWGRVIYVPGRWRSGMCFSRAPIQLPSGDLLVVTGTCRVKDDVRDSCILFRSSDGGATWAYENTVAYDPEIGSENEGFTESSIARFSDGELVVMSRTGSGHPMYFMRSSDDGKSWSKPVSNFVGVDPELVVMSNGVLACSYGRVLPRENQTAIATSGPAEYFSTGNHIIFSADRGESWTEPTSISEGPSHGYTGLEEIAEGVLLYVYDIAGYVQWGGINKIQAVDIHIDV